MVMMTPEDRRGFVCWMLILAGAVSLIFGLAVAAKAGNSVSLDGVVAPLAEKTRAIQAACGSRVVSSVRKGARVFGGSYSNHASGRAVDLQGNPRCIYAQLRGWPGGVSTDYWTAPGGPHVHVSYSPNGMEWGSRFKHRQPKRKP
jgi:hypothetical protein